MKIRQNFYVSFMILYILILSEMGIKSKNPKIWNHQSKVLQNFAIRNINNWGITWYQMNNVWISTNWRISNLCISKNSWKNHMHVILSPNYSHSASNTDVKFAPLVIANQSILWNFQTFPWFFGQFSYSLTFPSFPGSMVTLNKSLSFKCQKSFDKIWANKSTLIICTDDINGDKLCYNLIFREKFNKMRTIESVFIFLYNSRANNFQTKLFVYLINKHLLLNWLLQHLKFNLEYAIQF